MNIFVSKENFVEADYEFVERKGIGHPDTLADGLAEYLSAQYSKYTLENFGAILHHNFDKVGLLGGASSVKFGYGKLTSPVRVLINGRASSRFGKTNIPVERLLKQWATVFLKEKLPLLTIPIDLKFHYNLSIQSSPGKTKEKGSDDGARKYWFEPRSLDDVPELKKLVANDTSLGVGYAPYSRLESIVLEIEKKLNSSSYKKKNPWVGSDIKIMGLRSKEFFGITMCIPQISKYVLGVDEYRKNIKTARKDIHKIFLRFNVKEYSLGINTRDNFEHSELYLTAIGSSIESGDEGLVGRGNRVNGLISPTKPMSMEGACGKNPVYHIGKVYYVVANEISKKIFKKYNVQNKVALISQSGRDLLDPWAIFVSLPKNFFNTQKVMRLIENEVKSIPKVTQRLLEQKIVLY